MLLLVYFDCWLNLVVKKMLIKGQRFRRRHDLGVGLGRFQERLRLRKLPAPPDNQQSSQVCKVTELRETRSGGICTESVETDFSGTKK